MGLLGPELYYTPVNTGCRAVLMCIKELNIDIELKEMKMNQQRTPWFVNMNPQATVPTLTDENDFVLWESQAILQYLVNKYGANRRDLYPEDPEQRAAVDRILLFDNGSLRNSFKEFFYPPLTSDKDPDVTKENAFKQNLEYVDFFLTRNRYIAGDQLTIADFSVLASITQLEGLDYRIKAYGHLYEWVETLKRELPYYDECNTAGIEEFRTWVKSQKYSYKIRK